MFTAIDNYQVGKEKESRAIDVYGKPGSKRHNRFRCPECGEMVILTKNVSPFFRHYKKTVISPECDRRVDGNCQLSYKERTGLPLYIKNERDGFFSLYILMPTLSDNVIEEAERQNSYVSIFGSDTNTYYINSERFIGGKITYLPVTFLQRNNYNIKISETPCRHKLLYKWATYAEGFWRGRAIFSGFESGGRKVYLNDSISTDIEYLLVCSSNTLFYVDGVLIEHIGELVFDREKISVHKVIFAPKDDKEFSRIDDYLWIYYRVHLLLKKPELIPVWPPMIKEANQYAMTIPGMALFRVQSGNDNPMVYEYENYYIKNVEYSTSAVSDCYYLESYIRNGNRKVFSVDRKYVGSEIEVICDGSLNYQFAKHDLLFVTDSNGEKLGLDTDYVLSGKSQIINIETRIKAECILFRKGVYHDSYCTSKEKQNISIEIRTGDLLEIRDDYALLGTIRIVSDINERISVQQLMDYEKDKWVNLPAWYKKVLFEFKSDQHIYALMRKYYKMKRVPMRFLEYIRGGKV